MTNTKGVQHGNSNGGGSHTANTRSSSSRSKRRSSNQLRRRRVVCKREKYEYRVRESATKQNSLREDVFCSVAPPGCDERRCVGGRKKEGGVCGVVNDLQQRIERAGLATSNRA